MSDHLKDIHLRHQRCENELKHQQVRTDVSGDAVRGATPLATAIESWSDVVPVAANDSMPPSTLFAMGAPWSCAGTATSWPITSTSSHSEATPLDKGHLSYLTHPGSAAVHTCRSKHHYRTRPPRLRSTAKASMNTEMAPSKVTAGASADAQWSSPPAVSSLAMPEVTTASVTAASLLSAATPAPPLVGSATLALPFAPYPVQQQMSSMFTDVLHSASPHVVPVAVAEVPTGCGKTMALLSSVLRYQQELKCKSPKELDLYLRPRRPPWQRQQSPGERRKTSPQWGGRQRGLQKCAAARLSPSARDNIGAGERDNGSECGDDWSVPPWFFRHFRVNSERKIRAELDVTGSQELRRRFLPPPCTVYYVTRTHAQLRQAVRELRRLHGATTATRMNILGSRERYCIHPKVMEAKANHTLPVEGNNLGEVCDKLVSLGLW